MDHKKIGSFLTAERKAKGLTQAALAEQLFLSEKTVSKWENGKGLPDTQSLPKLCEIFGCTLNELLNGERIAAEDYASKADEKLLELQKNKVESDRRLLTAEIVLGVVCVLFFLMTVLLGSYLAEHGQITWGAICIAVSFVLILVAVTYMLIIEQRAGYYQCAECGHKHVPSFRSVFFSAHMGRTRYMKCPRCGKKSWQKKVVE